MKKISVVSLATLFLVGLCLGSSSWKIEEKEEIRKTLKFQDPSGLKELQIDNFFGSIKVEGYNNQEVQLIVHKTVKGCSKEKIQKAWKEVRLEITKDGNTIDLYVDGPFRCRWRDERGRRRSWRDPGYQVHYDFELKVPHKTKIFLKTVNKGEIKVKNVEGEFEIKNVNGRIEIIEAAGSGKARTVNGEVKVLFSRNPVSDCSFHTINGDVEVVFTKNLSADFRVKTFNGDVYSDFPVTYLPADASVQDRQKGKFVYKSNRFFGVRVGKGGPEVKLDTLNGDILISKRK